MHVANLTLGMLRPLLSLKACEEADAQYQIYVNRSDIPGGSTVGSISSAMLPMRTIDVGLPLLAMHSARELMGAADQEQLNRLMNHFLGGK